MPQLHTILKQLKRSLNEAYSLDEGKTYVTSRDLKSKKGVEIPSGSRVGLSWERNKETLTRMTAQNGDVITVSTPYLFKYVRGFAKPPSMKALEKWTYDGVAKSITGARVEPDGHGPDGAPSWLLALGYI